jgi:hypothetical protein
LFVFGILPAEPDRGPTPFRGRDGKLPPTVIMRLYVSGYELARLQADRAAVAVPVRILQTAITLGVNWTQSAIGSTDPARMAA